jgi:hypothetical protein
MIFSRSPHEGQCELSYHIKRSYWTNINTCDTEIYVLWKDSLNNSMNLSVPTISFSPLIQLQGKSKTKKQVAVRSRSAFVPSFPEHKFKQEEPFEGIFYDIVEFWPPG